MEMLRNIKKWLFGTGFEVGDRVYWENRYFIEYTGEYVVTSKKDEQGLVGVYNEKKKYRKVYWYELESLE